MREVDRRQETLSSLRISNGDTMLLQICEVQVACKGETRKVEDERMPQGLGKNG